MRAGPPPDPRLRGLVRDDSPRKVKYPGFGESVEPCETGVGGLPHRGYASGASLGRSSIQVRHELGAALMRRRHG